MKRSVLSSQLLGFAFTALGGTLLHFLYDWLGKSPWIAPFSGVNESTWEHMKLLFWPMLIYGVLQLYRFRDRRDLPCVKMRGILLGLALIPLLFYTYNGAIGKSPDWLNITIFFLSAAIAYLYETRLLLSGRLSTCSRGQPAAVLTVLALCFVLFTFLPPHVGLFRDPLTGTYGI